MSETHPSYLSYLLRLQRIDGVGRPTWRVSLEIPGSGKQLNFENLLSVFAYLTTQMGVIEAKGVVMDEFREL